MWRPVWHYVLLIPVQAILARQLFSNENFCMSGISSSMNLNYELHRVVKMRDQIWHLRCTRQYMMWCVEHNLQVNPSLHLSLLFNQPSIRRWIFCGQCRKLEWNFENWRISSRSLIHSLTAKWASCSFGRSQDQVVAGRRIGVYSVLLAQVSSKNCPAWSSTGLASASCHSNRSTQIVVEGSRRSYRFCHHIYRRLRHRVRKCFFQFSSMYTSARRSAAPAKILHVGTFPCVLWLVTGLLFCSFTLFAFNLFWGQWSFMFVWQS
jgi:hypothetical protein